MSARPSKPVIRIMRAIDGQTPLENMSISPGSLLNVQNSQLIPKPIPARQLNQMMWSYH